MSRNNEKVTNNQGAKMKRQDFNIGDTVYTLHTDRNNGIFLKYQLVVGVKTKMVEMNFQVAHLSSDLNRNIQGFIYHTMTIYTNEEGKFFLAYEDGIDRIKDTHIFETVDDARSYLFHVTDTLQVVS